MTRARRGPALGLALALVLAAGACGGDDTGADDDGALPPAGPEVALRYRATYAVTTPDATTTEEVEVARPLASRIVVRNAEGAVTSERWSAEGLLVTRSAGADAVSLAVALAPAAGDQRLDRTGAALVEAGHLEAGKVRTVRGRTCTPYAERSALATLPDGADVTDARPVQAVVERCVDTEGIVLEERWSTPEGRRLLTKRIDELATDDDLELDLDAPDAEPLAAEQGNGAVRRVADDEAPPFAERFSLPDPAGFDHRGRFAVVPPRVGTDTPAAADLALYTDVWTRGPDLLLLDQGAGRNGATPFAPGTVLGPLTLAGLGPAELAGDLRGLEVRVTRPDGGFVRLAGTVPLDELLRLADELRTEDAP